jgi:hypothetical protein
MIITKILIKQEMTRNGLLILRFLGACSEISIIVIFTTPNSAGSAGTRRASGEAPKHSWSRVTDSKNQLITPF